MDFEQERLFFTGYVRGLIQIAIESLSQARMHVPEFYSGMPDHDRKAIEQTHEELNKAITAARLAQHELGKTKL